MKKSVTKITNKLKIEPILPLPQEFQDSHEQYHSIIQSIFNDLFVNDLKDLTEEQKVEYLCKKPIIKAKLHGDSSTYLQITLIGAPLAFYPIMPYFSCLVSDRLVLGKRLHIVDQDGVEFYFSKAKTPPLFFMQVIVEFASEQDQLEAEKNLPFLLEELHEAALSKSWADYLMETRGLPLDENLAEIHRLLRHLMKLRPNRFREDILKQLKRFVSITKKNFRLLRLPHQILKIICYMYFLPELLYHQLQSQQQKNSLILRLFPMKVHYPFGIRKTLGIFVCINLLNAYQMLSQSQILKAILCIQDNVQIANDTFFHYSDSENLWTIYLEIEKIDGKAFSANEIQAFKAALPPILKSHIETHVQPLYFPIKEDHSYEKTQKLMQQIQSKNDLPQMRIDFTGQEEHFLNFQLLIGLGEEKDSERSFVTSDYPISIELKEKQIFQQNDLKKTCFIFDIKLIKKKFLRSDNAIDLLQARSFIVNQIIKRIGPIRDINGGMITKQNERFQQFKGILDANILDQTLIENFFYHFTPTVMQSILPAEVVKELFLLCEKSTEKEAPHGVYSKYRDGHSLVVISSNNPLCKEYLDRSIEQITMSDSVASTYILQEGLIHIGYIFASKDPNKLRHFSNTLQQAFHEWSQKETQTKRLKLRLNRGLSTLDPREGGDQHTGFLVRKLYDGLMRFGMGDKLEFALASSVDTSDDHKTFTFHLKNATWSNGDSITAHDFEYSWKKVVDPNSNTRFASVFFVIKNAKAVNSNKLPIDRMGVKALDDKTLQVELENPCAYFLDMCGHWTYFPIHKQSDLTTPGWAYAKESSHISCGPFCLEAIRHNKIFLEKNKSYWDQEKVKLEKIEIHIREDSSQDLEMFNKGELDYFGQPLSVIPFNVAKRLQKENRLSTYSIAAVTRLELNTQIFPFNNVNFRKALAYSLNRKELAKQTPGPSLPTTLLIPSVIGVSEEDAFEDGNKKLAKRCFEQALDEMKISVKQLSKLWLFYGNSGLWSSCVQSIQKTWKEIFGIEIASKKLPWEEMLKTTTNGNFQIKLMSWYCWYKDPIYIFEVFKSRDHTLNASKWSDPDFLEQIKISEESIDPEVRKKGFQEAHKIIIDQMPVIPLFQDIDFYVINPKLKNVHLSVLGDIDFKEAYFD